MASRKLVVELVGDSRQLDRTFQKSTRNAKKFEQTMTSALGGGGIRGMAGRGGPLAAGALAAGATFVKTTQLASNLNEEISRSGVVFGASAKEIQAWSKTTAKGFGIAQTEALQAADNFGTMFSTIGIAQGEASGMSQRLVELAADLASFNNEDPSDMLDRLRSGLAGEAEPLRRFGILLSEARVKQEAYATGIAKAGAKLTEQQKVQARYSLILKDTKLAHGDFARTSGNLANQQRILRAQTEELATSIGTKLLPVMTGIVTAANDGVTALGELGDAMEEEGTRAEGLAGAIANYANSVGHFASQIAQANVNIRQGIQSGGRGPTRPSGPGFAVGPRGAPGALQRLRAAQEAAAAARRRGTPEQRNQWFDANIARQLDRVQDLALGKQLARLKAIAKEVRARLAVTKDATRRLTLEDQLLDIQRQQQAVMEGQASAAQEIVDKIKAANEALKDRAAAIKSAIVERLQRKQTDILNKRALADAQDALRIARLLGTGAGIQAAMRQLQDVQFDIDRARVEAAPATLTKGGVFALGGVITININGITDPEAVAKKVAEVLQRRTRRTTTQMRGPAAGAAA